VPDIFYSFSTYQDEVTYLKSWVEERAQWMDANIGRLSGISDGERAGRIFDFRLGRNYPNPFNSSTKIGYTLKTGGKVRLTVVDPAGRELAVLVDGVQGAGSHEVSFSGTGLISGIYIYRLQTVDGTATGKMSYIK
jgi:hypothetical protein